MTTQHFYLFHLLKVHQSIQSETHKFLVNHFIEISLKINNLSIPELKKTIMSKRKQGIIAASKSGEGAKAVKRAKKTQLRCEC